MKIQSHRELRAWQRAIDLVTQTYRLTAGFPREETYGLKMQVRRAAVSIPSNIAEGHRRPHRKEFLHLLAIADGSLAELDTQMEIARRLDYLSDADHDLSTVLATEVGKMLTKLRASLGEPWRNAPIANR